MLDYYGHLNEVKAGARSDIPVKPDILFAVETCREQHIPMVPGGLVDQPVIWMEQYKAVVEIIRLFEDIDKANAQK